MNEKAVTDADTARRDKGMALGGTAQAAAATTDSMCVVLRTRIATWCVDVCLEKHQGDNAQHQVFC